MQFIGLDVHKRVIEAAVLDAAGAVRARDRFACTREALADFCRRHVRAGDGVALEATTNTWAVIDALAACTTDVRLVVSNPLRTRAIAEAKVKTDRVDAEVLAQLLRCDYLPSVWTPDAETRRLRTLTSRRARLVGQRTACKNRLHAVLHQRLIEIPAGRLFGRDGRAWLDALPLDPDGRAAVDSELRLLAVVDAEIAELEATLVQAAGADPRVKVLLTLPGVDVTVALGLLAALGDLSRFPSGAKAAAYLGLVPRTKQSADHTYHGPLTKAGRSHTRWLMIQAAQHVDRHPGPLGVFFRRKAKQKNRNVAVCAVARKMVEIAWQMLTKNEPYRYAQPGPTQAKLTRLRTRTGGRRRTTGPKPGATRPETYGTGERTRATPSLPEVLASEGLPALPPAPPGEARTVAEAGVGAFVERIQHPDRRRGRSGKRPTDARNTQALEERPPGRD